MSKVLSVIQQQMANMATQLGQMQMENRAAPPHSNSQTITVDEGVGDSKDVADEEDTEHVAAMARLRAGSPRDRIGASRVAAQAWADVADAGVAADAAADKATNKPRGNGTTTGTIATVVATTSKTGTQAQHA